MQNFLPLIKISEISIICSLRKSENYDLLLKLFRNTATFEKENPFREIPEKNGKILRRLTSLSENWFVEGIHSPARLLFAEEEGRGGGRVARGVAPIKIGMEQADGKTYRPLGDKTLAGSRGDALLLFLPSFLPISFHFVFWTPLVIFYLTLERFFPRLLSTLPFFFKRRGRGKLDS